MIVLLIIAAAFIYLLGIVAAYNYWANNLHASTSIMLECKDDQAHCPSAGCEMGACMLALVWPGSWIVLLVVKYTLFGLAASLTAAAHLGKKLSVSKGE